MKLVKVYEVNQFKNEEVHYIVSDRWVFLHVVGAYELSHIIQLFNNLSNSLNGDVISYCAMNGYTYELIYEGFIDKSDFIRKYPEYVY